MFIQPHQYKKFEPDIKSGLDEKYLNGDKSLEF